MSFGYFCELYRATYIPVSQNVTNDTDAHTICYKKFTAFNEKAHGLLVLIFALFVFNATKDNSVENHYFLVKYVLHYLK